MPLLRTAKRVKRSLTPVQPSPAFRASLEGELLGVARRMAVSRGNALRAVVSVARPATLRNRQVPAVLSGFAVASMLVALALILFRARRR